MDKKDLKRFLAAAGIFLGILFVFLGLLAYYNGLKISGFAGILWFSYTALLLIGIGILTKNPYLIASQVNIVFIPYLFWNVDFFYVLFTGNSLFGITDYFFQSRPLLSQIITLQHVFIIPISFLALYLMELKRKDFWKLSVIEVAVFFFIIKILKPTENINCIFENCLPFEIQIIPYEITWFAAYLLMISITTGIIIYFKKLKPRFKNLKTDEFK